jgi:transposase
MLYTGLDIHKRYSVACTVDAQGRPIREGRIDHFGEGAREAFGAYFRGLPEPSEVLLEACWNWGTVYDCLEGTAGVAEVLVSHPAKNRIIAEAKIKTDRLDARALSTLLRGRFFARVHVPSSEVRRRKNLIRQRLWMARERTRVRNRIHALLDRHPQVARPQFKDVFCKKGIAWMRRAPLPQPERKLLDDDLELLALMGRQIHQLESLIDEDNAANPLARRLQTLPGVGPILACVIALEIDRIDRFPRAAKLCAYVGLIPSTYSTGGKTTHGKMLFFCNRWLKWAFIEAAWVAIGCSDYFGQFYRRQRQRGKGANEAITIVSRRMATIVWHMLKQERDYCSQPPPRPESKRFSPAALREV